jgi:glucose/arabinose dehydrogenase/lysophospholipase L1-like esterase
VIWLAALALLPQHWETVTLDVPADLHLEVSGITILADGRPMVCTRRGQVFVLDNAYSPDGKGVVVTEFTEGLQEPLGLLPHDGWIYVTQRGELSRMRDVDGDDRMDELETVADTWEISGNYHEYNFGPRLGPEGRLWVTTNKPFGDEPFGRAHWRGFALAFDADGAMEPIACGLRSPAGVQNSPWGGMFYTDNQGEWVGMNKLSELRPGSFHGHPWGIFSCELWDCTGPREGEVPSGLRMGEAAAQIPRMQLPAVWFPYDEMGRSASGLVWDQTEGGFGPFAGQVFVGDQFDASVNRVSLERVGGRWQGACYPFVDGLASGVLRLTWGADDSLFVGMTDRGWGSLGRHTYGLQRLVWSGETPFELLEMRARPGGFELEFTRPLDRELASDPATWRMESYTYLQHSDYGSPEIDTEEPEITAAELDADGVTVRIDVDGLRPVFVHELRFPDLRAADGEEPRFARAYYTLIEMAGGPLRVLLIGDSISNGYTPVVRELLGEGAFVARPMRGLGSENCEGTTYGVANLDRWLALEGGNWDVIHFNFGLHDLKRVHPETGANSSDPSDPRQAELDVYESQLRSIVQRLQATGAELVFATTTPVPEEPVQPWRDSTDPALYNAVARRVMSEAGIPVNDLYGFAAARLTEIQNPADVHFTEAGTRALGGEVADAILTLTSD